MSDPNSLGSLVRRRRLESGYSLGQLASKVGKTAAEVRAWERGAELPEHGIIERLAETLELDLDEIQARLAAERATADEQSAEDTEQPADDSGDEAPAEPEGAAAIFIEPDVPVEFPEEPADDLDDEPGFSVEDPFTPPPPEPEDEAEEVTDFDLLEAPTEPVPVPVITETATAARAERAVAVLEERPRLPTVEAAPDSDPGLLRYLEPLRILFDPNNRYLYWIRAGLTIVVLLIFAVIIFRELGNLLDAISQLLDTIEPAATNQNELDAFISPTLL
jgi:transcriptional regulator with XRE-family HTH domain